jgi:hypothetical protein
MAAQESLPDSVKKLHDVGFDETLREFRDSLVALKPVFGKPEGAIHSAGGSDQGERGRMVIWLLQG